MTPPTSRAQISRRCAWILLGALAAAAGWALNAGPYPVPLQNVLAHLGGQADALTQVQHAVLFDLRLPRLLAAIVVGGGLAVSGSAFQAILRNPLADPSFVGVSGGAAVAAAATLAGLSTLPGMTILSPQWLVPVAAFLGGLTAAGLVLRISRIDGDMQAITLLLAGLAINAVAGGLLGLIAYAANDPTLRVITLWLFGSLSRASWAELAVAAPCMSIAALLIWRRAAALNALLLGEAEAMHIGIDVPRLRRSTIGLAVLCTAFAVAIAGIIGFVGLMVPHLLRLLIGPDHRRLVPLSFVAGALLLTLADTLSRIAIQPGEIPVGIVTALLGGPFFLMLLLRWRKVPGLHAES